MGLNQVVVVAR